MEELKEIKERVRAKSAMGLSRNDAQLESTKVKKKKRRVVSVRRFRINSDGSHTLLQSVPKTA